MSFDDTLREHRRLAILRHLAGCSSYRSNASILVDVCNGVGVRSTREDVVRDLAWLSERALVAIEDHAEFVIAEATQRGVEAATGARSVEGVKRPRAGG